MKKRIIEWFSDDFNRHSVTVSIIVALTLISILNPIIVVYVISGSAIIATTFIIWYEFDDVIKEYISEHRE